MCATEELTSVLFRLEGRTWLAAAMLDSTAAGESGGTGSPEHPGDRGRTAVSGAQPSRAWADGRTSSGGWIPHEEGEVGGSCGPGCPGV